MRLIDADALIEEYAYASNDWDRARQKFALVVVDVNDIKNAPTIDAVSEWIPCEERLPSEDGEYLVTWGEGFVSAFYYGKPTNYRHKEVKGKCFYEYNDEYGDAVCNDAIAWMPLPKPYGEREGE